MHNSQGPSWINFVPKSFATSWASAPTAYSVRTHIVFLKYCIESLTWTKNYSSTCLFTWSLLELDDNHSKGCRRSLSDLCDHLRTSSFHNTSHTRATGSYCIWCIYKWRKSCWKSLFLDGCWVFVYKYGIEFIESLNLIEYPVWYCLTLEY